MNRITILLLLIFSAVLIIMLGRFSPVETNLNTPWSIEHLDNDNISVFGVILGESKLDAVLDAFKQQPQHSILVTPQQSLKLMSRYADITLDGLVADIEVRYNIPQAEIDKLLSSQTSLKPLQSFDIAASQLHDLRDAVAYSLSYRPYIHFDEDIILQRFGYPDFKQVINEQQRWVYKDMHLQIFLNTEQADNLLYTADKPEP